MKHIELINQFREELAQLVLEIESSSAMGHFDLNKISEDVVCGLFQQLCGFDNLRNLNSQEKLNFPGIDLADDEARIAVQISSDKSLEKLKNTLKTIINHRLYEIYDRFIFYVLTRKQASYSTVAIAEICGDLIQFDVKRDILDHRDLSTRAATVDPFKLKTALEMLLSYTRGLDVGLADEDFDPPKEPEEQLGTNLVEIYFPPRLFIAEILPEILKSSNGRKVRNHRKGVKDFGRESGQPIPSDFEASGGRLITFHDLGADDCPFRYLVDEGTVEAFEPSDYYAIDDDHERVFKSLLRFTLQQKLYRKDVMWQHHEGRFIFLPSGPNRNKRSEEWTEKVTSSRMVFERRFKTAKKKEVLSTRHFAFGVDFLRLDDRWYVSLTPGWFFSYGDQYRRSLYGDRLLSGLKRMEKNRSVYDQCRFLASWLESTDREDLFSDTTAHSPTISFASPLRLFGGRALDERLWEPLQVEAEDALQGRLALS